MSSRKLSSLINKNPNAISSYETGKSIPPTEVIFQLAKIFEVPAGAILTEDLSDAAMLHKVTSGEWGLQDEEELKRIEREKKLLHQALDAGEERLERFSQAVAKVRDEMGKISPDSPLYAQMQALIRILDGVE